jgi:hypothetical protein
MIVAEAIPLTTEEGWGLDADMDPISDAEAQALWSPACAVAGSTALAATAELRPSFGTETTMMITVNNLAEEPFCDPRQRLFVGLGHRIGRLWMHEGDELNYQLLVVPRKQSTALIENLPTTVSPTADEVLSVVFIPTTPNKPEVVSDDPLNRQALEFLQTVYGRDRRLDRLSQQTAVQLTDRLLYEYGLHYDDAEMNTELLDNPEYEHAATAVSAYVRNETMSQIVEKYDCYDDSLSVELTMNDVAARLRRYDGDRRAINPNERFLEDILGYYGGPANETRGKWQMTPVGFPLVPIIEGSNPTDWQNHRNALEQDVAKLENRYLEKLAKDAEWAVYEYAASSEFRRAAERKDHTKEGEVFAIGPGDNDEDSRALRKMAWLVSTAVFARKDGNTLEEMQEGMNDESDYFVLAVDQSGEHPRPMGALHARTQSDESLISVQDIWYEWGEPIREAMHKAGLPDLRYASGVMDIMTVAVLPWYESGGANSLLYNRACVLADVLGIEYFVNVFDKGPAAMVNRFGDAFKSFKGLEPKNYKARKKDANSSLPRVANTNLWKEWLHTNSPVAYRRFWDPNPVLGKRYKLADMERFRKLHS